VFDEPERQVLGCNLRKADFKIHIWRLRDGPAPEQAVRHPVPRRLCPRHFGLRPPAARAVAAARRDLRRRLRPSHASAPSPFSASVTGTAHAAARCSASRPFDCIAHRLAPASVDLFDEAVAFARLCDESVRGQHEFDASFPSCGQLSTIDPRSC
jgi:hypothetical protein